MDCAVHARSGARHARPRDLSRGGRDAGYVRDGRCAELLDVRGDHGSERELLPVHELRFDERVQLGRVSFLFKVF